MEKLFKILLVLLIFSFCQELKSQTGIIQIDVDQYEFDDEFLTIQIHMDDSLVSEKKDFLKNLDLFVDTLPVGTYSVSCYMNQSKDITQTINGVQIKRFKITDLTLDLPKPNYYDDRMSNDTSITVSNKAVVSMHFLTGNSFVNKNNTFSGYNQIGVKFGMLNEIMKHISFGQQVGSNISYTYFNTTNSLEPSIIKDSEKYTYWNFNYMIFVRLTTFNNKTWNTKGLYLDGGISYNFPLMFRHVMRESDTKIVTNKIHRYNDFSAIFRLGYKPISLMFEYRLTNFLDKNYPEQPKMKIGVAFMFADN